MDRGNRGGLRGQGAPAVISTLPVDAVVVILIVAAAQVVVGLILVVDGRQIVERFIFLLTFEKRRTRQL